ncbi:MAG: winged helix-turn-helix domain-containing protein [Acidobacteriota bacterium]|nr:winged helix-turn-helix domain-containing protein [Acidobacteriota bacterium]
MERRRLAAAQELLNGLSQSRVARKFGVSRTTTSRWHRALTRQGVESLRKRRATGRPSRLTSDQLKDVARMYTEGARAHGFFNDRWTTARLAKAIEEKFGVHYDQDHVGRLMHKLGLRERRVPDYAASRYSPNTSLSASEISPTVAY